MLNRRLLMAQAKAEPPGGGIVTDGLAFRLNGLNQGGIPGKWIDEIGGSIFSLNGVEQLTNGCLFDGKSKGVCDKIIDMPYTGTIEFAISNCQRISDNACIISGPDGNVLAHFRLNRPKIELALRPDSAYSIQNVIFKDKSTISAWSDKQDKVYGYCNLRKALPYRRNATPGLRTKTTVIGATEWRGKPDSCLKGIIHEIRYYNRVLDETEILQNQQHDIDTYFGGVIPE